MSRNPRSIWNIIRSKYHLSLLENSRLERPLTEMAITKVSTINVDGADLFYRSAGSPSSPTILLLHGFPSSSLAPTTLAFLDALHIPRFAVYIFDYGAPVALRMALQRPDAITAIITQNGNAYVDGLR